MIYILIIFTKNYLVQEQQNDIEINSLISFIEHKSGNSTKIHKQYLPYLVMKNIVLRFEKEGKSFVVVPKSLPDEI